MSKAEKRAEELLLSHLDRDQQLSLYTKGWFEIVSQYGNIYRIYRGESMNVMRVNRQGLILSSHCALPVGVPIPDTMLAQMILLKCEEKYFLRKANSVSYR